jgi:SCY1-like protein 1
MGKGLQLGTNKATAGIILAAQLAEEAAAREDVDNNAWGPGDLMDVNADQDDWSQWPTFYVIYSLSIGFS